MLCTDVECFLVVSMCWRRTSFCEKKKKNPSAGSLPSCLMGDLTYFFLEREEEREDRRWRERYRDKVFAQPSQWKNACSRDSVGQECKLICPTESRNISFFGDRFLKRQKQPILSFSYCQQKNMYPTHTLPDEAYSSVPQISIAFHQLSSGYMRRTLMHLSKYSFIMIHLHCSLFRPLLRYSHAMAANVY